MNKPKCSLRIVVAIIVTMVIVSGLNYWIFNNFLQKGVAQPVATAPKEGQSWLDLPPLVAHAGGGVRRQLSNETYRNSIEAFLQNYELGHRVFEFDFYIDGEGSLVVDHGETLDREDRMDITELMNLMHEYKDAYIVTDTKITSDETLIRSQFEQLRDAASSVDTEIINRIIPQIYNQEMLPTVLSTWDYNNIIYTLYMSPDSNDEVVDFAMTNPKIKAITCYGDREKVAYLAPKVGKIGLKFYVHTLNAYTDFSDWANLGVTGWYTDFLIPRDHAIWKSLDQ